MSFILDALKKSETDRQQRGTAEFAGVPSSSRRREGPPVWLWIVGALLLINLAVLIGVLLRPEMAAVEPVVTQVAEPEPRAMDDFASKIEADCSSSFLMRNEKGRLMAFKSCSTRPEFGFGNTSKWTCSGM